MIYLGPPPVQTTGRFKSETALYGLVQWGAHDCWIFVGSRDLKLPFTAPIVASGLLLIALLLLVAAWHFIGNLRHRDAPGDA